MKVKEIPDLPAPTFKHTCPDCPGLTMAAQTQQELDLLVSAHDRRAHA